MGATVGSVVVAVCSADASVAAPMGREVTLVGTQGFKGYPPAEWEDDPAAEYLKYKSWLVSLSFADGRLQSFERFVSDCVAAAERMEPLRVFFNDALSGIHGNPMELSDWD